MYNYSHIIFLQYREKSHDTHNDIYVRKKEPKLLFFDSSHFFIVPIKSLNIIKNGQFTIFFCRFTKKDIYSQKKNSKLRHF